MIRFIETADEKRRIAREILESLTDWFEVEESREKNIADSAGQPFWASVDEDIIEGFLCLKVTGKETMELAVMGVRKESHRKRAWQERRLDSQVYGEACIRKGLSQMQHRLLHHAIAPLKYVIFL